MREGTYVIYMLYSPEGEYLARRSGFTPDFWEAAVYFAQELAELERDFRKRYEEDLRVMEVTLTTKNL